MIRNHWLVFKLRDVALDFHLCTIPKYRTAITDENYCKILTIIHIILT